MLVMETILYFRTLSNQSSAKKLTGVLEMAAKWNWHVQVVDAYPTASSVRHLKEYWSPCGAIVECGTRLDPIDAKIFGKLHVVYLDHDPDSIPQSSFCVFHDSEAATRLAAKELLMTGFPHFAFIPSPAGHFWSQKRKEVFSSMLELHGKTCRVFSSNAVTTDSPHYHRDMRKFLQTLPKPCAVLAVNDKMASTVIDAATFTHISIPYELAVVGIDNIESICDHTSPTLSSVEPDFRRGGEMSAVLLRAILCYGSRFRGKRKIAFGPIRLIRRASTRLLKNVDRDVTAAIDFIAREACSGIGAGRVAKCFSCSRRMAELRFRRATGHTILDEIHAVRLEQAKRILASPKCNLKLLNEFCGFATANSLRKFFRKETGMTLSQWRAAPRVSQNQDYSERGSSSRM